MEIAMEDLEEDMAAMVGDLEGMVVDMVEGMEYMA